MPKELLGLKTALPVLTYVFDSAPKLLIVVQDPVAFN